MASAVMEAIASSLSDYPCLIFPAQALGAVVYQWAKKSGAEATDYLTIWLKRRFKSTREKWVNQVNPLPTSVSPTVVGDEDEDVLEVVIDSSNM